LINVKLRICDNGWTADVAQHPQQCVDMCSAAVDVTFWFRFLNKIYFFSSFSNKLHSI